MDLGSVMLKIDNPTIKQFEFGLTKDEDKEYDQKLVIADKYYSQLMTADQIFSGLVACEGIMNRMVDKGEKMEPTTLKLLNVNLKPAYQFLGAKKDSYLPGLEVFTDKKTAHAAVNIGLEEVIDVIRRLVEKIGKIMAFIWEHLKDFFQYFMKKMENVESTMRDLFDRIFEINPDAKPLEEFINSLKPGTESADKPVFLKKHLLFAINGKCDGRTTEQIIRNTATLLQANRKIIVEMMHSLEMIAVRNPSEHDIEQEAERLVKEIKESMSQFTQTDRKSEGHQMVWSYGYFYDGQRFRLSEDVGKAHSEDNVRLFNIDLEMVQSVVDDDYQVRVLSRQEMAQIGKDTVDLVEKSKDFDRVVPIIEKTLKSTSMKLHSTFVDTDDKTKRASVMASLQLMSDILRYVRTNLPKISRTAYDVASDATVYVRSSLERYKPA